MPIKPARKTATKRRTARAADTSASPVVLRLAKARSRDDLPAPSPDEISAFQQAFLRQSGLLVFTEDPAVLHAGRAKKPEPGERAAAFMTRVFGSRTADVSFAQFVGLDGRSLMSSIVSNNAGRALKGFLTKARYLERKAVEELHAEEVLAVQKRMKAQQKRSQLQQAKDRERLARYPAEWLEDRANEAQDINDRASGTPVYDARVIERLRSIAREARQHAETDSTGGVPLEFVFDQLLVAYEAMAQHERRLANEVKQIQEQLDRLRRQ